MDLKIESVKKLVVDNHKETIGKVEEMSNNLGFAMERLEDHDKAINNFKAWKIGIGMSVGLITVIAALVVYIYADFKNQVENNFDNLKILIKND